MNPTPLTRLHHFWKRKDFIMKRLVLEILLYFVDLVEERVISTRKYKKLM